MKKRIIKLTKTQKVIDYIQKKIDEYVIKRFQKLMPKEIIKSLYRAIAENELQITTREIFVKKGHIRFHLLIIKNKDLETVYNLSRPELVDLRDLLQFMKDDKHMLNSFDNIMKYRYEIISRLGKIINDGRYAAELRPETNIVSKQQKELDILIKN